MLARMSKKLSPDLDAKHKLFADKFLELGQISKAAREAGYAPKCAHVTGNKLLKRPDIQQYLASKAAKLTEQVEDRQTRLLRELEAMAFANIADFIRIDADGLPQVDFSNATPEQLKAITSVASKRRVKRDKDGTVTEDMESRFSMADKYRGLELLGKIEGMFKPEEHKVVVDVADRLLAARQRMARLSNGEAE